MNNLLIWWHKRQARKARLTMIAIADNYSCGSTLVEMFSNSYNSAKKSYEYHLGTLKKIDPAFAGK